MSNAYIQDELERKLKNWAEAQSPPIRIAYESASFTRDSNPYLQAWLIPAKTRNNEISGKHSTYLGIFQINIWTPSGAGRKKAQQIGDRLIDTFKLVPKDVNGISIESTPYLSAAIVDECGWYITPLTINYRYEDYNT